MTSKYEKIIIKIDNFEYLNWKSCLSNKLKDLKSKKIELFVQDIHLSCTEIIEIIEIANNSNCEIIAISSSSPMTIISSQSLGYTSQFIHENNTKIIKNRKVVDKNLIFSKTNFHQGTIRSGDYLESLGNLLILGDVNPGAIVSAEGNIIIWGRLLGIAHAGNKGDHKATISALQLRPVQIRIANIVARGPKEKPQLGLAEQAKIESEQIIISHIESI
tara:strand:+ start:779 stop:1432 length:654 start_codon:yes stop_codon:yes gene_type:complete